MITLADLLAMIGLFAVRIGIPLAITAGLVYLLKRLDKRWEEEARAEQRAQVAAQPGARPPAEQQVESPAPPLERRPPAGRAPAPAPQLPWIPPPQPAIRPGQQPQPGLAAAAQPRHCWDAKSCGEAARAGCPAFHRPDLPCWQARLEADGSIPEDCVDCERFRRYQLM